MQLHTDSFMQVRPCQQHDLQERQTLAGANLGQRIDGETGSFPCA
jgi:hypothetical protein